MLEKTIILQDFNAVKRYRTYVRQIRYKCKINYGRIQSRPYKTACYGSAL